MSCQGCARAAVDLLTTSRNTSMSEGVSSMDRSGTGMPIVRTVVPALQVRDSGERTRVVIPRHCHHRRAGDRTGSRRRCGPGHRHHLSLRTALPSVVRLWHDGEDGDDEGRSTTLAGDHVLGRLAARRGISLMAMRGRLAAHCCQLLGLMCLSGCISITWRPRSEDRQHGPAGVAR